MKRTFDQGRKRRGGGGERGWEGREGKGEGEDKRRMGRWKEEEGRERRKRGNRNSRSFSAVIKRELEVKDSKPCLKRKKEEEREEKVKFSKYFTELIRDWERESKGGRVVDGVSYVLQNNSLTAVHDRLLRVSQRARRRKD